jgi:rRNA-processing protein FCF1
MTTEAAKPRRKLKVILDSNALFVPFEYRIDIFTELERLMRSRFEPILLSPIRDELERLATQGSPKMRKNASQALKLAQRCKTVKADDQSGASADDIIMEVAREPGHVVFTNDRHLRKRLRDINVPVIYVRQKSYLAVDGRL